MQETAVRRAMGGDLHFAGAGQNLLGSGDGEDHAAKAYIEDLATEGQENEGENLGITGPSQKSRRRFLSENYVNK